MMKKGFEELKKAGFNPEWYEENEEDVIYVLFAGTEFLICETAAGTDWSVRRVGEETEYYVVAPDRIVSFLKEEVK